MGCLQSRQKMDVIRRSADLEGDSARRPHATSKHVVKPYTPLRSEKRFPIFGAEDNVMAETHMS